MGSQSLWRASATMQSFPRLVGDRRVDVLVVGAGIAGLTTALLLQRAGREVLLIEARRIGAGETGNTTAHLTEILDTRYHVLEAKFGRGGARAAAQSARASIDRIEGLAREIGESCEFRRVPGYLYSETRDQRRELERELESLRRVGSDVGWAEDVPLRIPVRGALRVDRQGQLHPLQYLRGLADLFLAAGGHLCEETSMSAFEDGEPCRVTTSGGEIRAREVLVLTNAPVSSKVALHTKLAAYRTYAIAGRLEDRWPAGLFWDVQDPYHYIRAHETGGGMFLVVGGEDHKTGQRSDTAECFRNLERYAHEQLGLEHVECRWSGQVIESVDGLPYIGKSPGSDHLHVATGFSGTGMTFGTLAAMILSDGVLGRRNPWAETYEARRIKPLAQAREFLSENVDFPAHLVRDRLARGEVHRVEEIPPGEGRLMRSGGKMLAIFKDAAGTLHTRSAVCTHLGCHVRWNEGERSWDCPCHGSRFSVDGEVVNGPATRELAREDLAAETEQPPA